jgi:nickel-dependent lactate racemase
MTIYYENAGANASLGIEDFREGLAATLDRLGQPKKILALPPDQTRIDSRAGEITNLLHQMVGDRLTDVMPALGTHDAMTSAQLTKMFGDLPQNLIREHRWRNDVVELGTVDRDFVSDVTEGIYNEPWPAEVNQLLATGGHDLILSIGQVVPHEVIGMANYNKNVFVGTGGKSGIHESHYLSALYGMERQMGRSNTPLRKILNEASDRFCNSMPIVYALTVVEAAGDGQKHVRGLFIGDSHEVFWRAAKLAAQVNCFRLDKPPKTVVVHMNPEKYKATWLANKAIYRTRMAIGDGGRLIVIAPAVKEFGEDKKLDELIRKFGYRTTPEILEFVKQSAELRQNLSAAAHLIHGSSEERFEIVYCPQPAMKSEIESVGYSFADADAMAKRYGIDGRADGWDTTADGEEFYFIGDPGLGLWMNREHPHAFEPDAS